MIKLPYRIIRTAILTLFLTGCSEDLSKMSILEQSLHQPDRFSGDKSSDKSRKPLDILEFSDVKADMKIIDLLGGGGYYTELFNYVVGDKGKVYIQNTTLFLRFSKDELEKRLKNNRLKNVVRLDSDFADMKLPKNVDLMFAAKIGTGNSVSTKLHRIDEKWATKDIESAGFKLIRTSDVLRNPNDDLNLDIWNKKVFRKTDRFVHLYEKPNT